jgi:hypothetical protein
VGRPQLSGQVQPEVAAPLDDAVPQPNAVHTPLLQAYRQNSACSTVMARTLLGPRHLNLVKQLTRPVLILAFKL